MRLAGCWFPVSITLVISGCATPPREYMAGALPNIPTLAAVQDAVNSGLVGDEATREQLIENIGVGYVITDLVERKLLKMNPVLLPGSLTGAMASIPALVLVTDAARNSVPAIGYAGTYTFANVILTFAGPFLMTL